MSRQSVYEGLKSAIQYNGLPYHHFEDSDYTIAFTSWKQFERFDKLLDNLPTPKSIKLNVYAEAVAGRTDGVSMTVDDDIQHLSYWDMYVDMQNKVAIFEEFLSQLYRHGCNPLAYDYEFFYATLSLADYARIEAPLANGHLLDKRPLVSNARDYKSIHLSFDC